MRTFEYVKITLKNLFSNFQVSILYFIGLPLIIGGAMGFMNQTLHGQAKEIKIDPIEIVIQDEDNSDSSRGFIEFLKSDTMKETIIVLRDGEKDFEATVVIPEGYGDAIKTFDKSTIKIKEKNTSIQKIQIVGDVIDSYHVELFKALKGESQNTDFEVVKLEMKQVESPYGFYSVSMIGLVFAMVILGLINNAVDKKFKGINDRVKGTPNSSVSILNMKALSYFVYSALSLFIYCMVYRAAGVAFTGNILVLIGIILIASILITSIIIFVSTIFGEKYAKVVAMALFMLPIIGGGVFFEGANAIAKLSPSYYVTELFSAYERVGSVSSKFGIIGVIILGSAVLYGLAALKEVGRRGKNETTMANMG